MVEGAVSTFGSQLCVGLCHVALETWKWAGRFSLQICKESAKCNGLNLYAWRQTIIVQLDVQKLHLLARCDCNLCQNVWSGANWIAAYVTTAYGWYYNRKIL